MERNWQQLISGFVDGELTSEEKVRAEKWLQTSPQARQWHAELLRQKEAIKQLPQLKAPHDLANRVLTKIEERKQKAKPHKSIIWWWPYATAASLFLTVTCGILMLYFRVTPNNDLLSATQPVQVQTNPKSPIATEPESTEDWRLVKTELAQLSSLWQLLWRKGSATWLGTIEGLQQVQYLQPTMELALEEAWIDLNNKAATLVQMYLESNKKSVLTSPLGARSSPFKLIEYKLPSFIEVRGVNLKDAAVAIRQGGLFHLDIACTDASKALGHVMNAGAIHGLRFVVDQDVPSPGDPPLPPNSKIRRPQSYVVYVENIHPSTLYRWLYSLEDEDRRSVARRRMEQQLKSMLLYPVEPHQTKLWADSLGVPVASMHVGPSRSQDKSPGPIPAVVMGMVANRSQKPATRDIRQILDNRTGPQSGRISLIMTLHPQKSSDPQPAPRGTQPTRPR